MTWSFGPTETFSAGEFAARLEACASPGASSTVRAECAYWLASREFDCRDVGEANATCVLGGVHVPVSAMSFSCVGSCPSEDASLATAGILPTTTVGDCALETRAGFVGACYSNARCQWLAETNVTSFGAFCPDEKGEYCCGSDVVRDDTAFPAGPGVLSSSSSVDYMKRLSHVTDLSFRVHYDVLPPSLVRVTVDAPYVTSDSEISTIVNGVQSNYAMCPSAYLIDFEDPVDPLPRSEDGYFRRASTQSQWSPLHFYPASDLLGRPRTPSGNFDFEYASAEQFRTRFDFPDVRRREFQRVGVDVDVGVPVRTRRASIRTRGRIWGSRACRERHVLEIGTRERSRQLHDGLLGLVSGYHRCRDYHTGASLVRVEHEGETYVGGVAYAVESYSWTLHLCQVGYFGPNCADTSKTQSYAKTCATIPSTFSIAPRQVSHVDTTPTSSGLVSKSFLVPCRPCGADVPSGTNASSSRSRSSSSRPITSCPRGPRTAFVAPPEFSRGRRRTCACTTPPETLPRAFSRRTTRRSRARTSSTLSCRLTRPGPRRTPRRTTRSRSSRGVTTRDTTPSRARDREATRSPSPRATGLDACISNSRSLSIRPSSRTS